MEHDIPDEQLPPLFQKLSREDAKGYLTRFVAELPASSERLAGMLASAGANSGLAHQTRPEALDMVWEVAISHWPMRWQDDYVHPQTTADPTIHKGTLGALGPRHLLPSWFIGDRIHALRFHQDTLWVIDVLARFLGQTLIEWKPSLAWAPGPARPANNIDRGYPVVAGSRTWVNPLRAVQGLVHRRITGADSFGVSFSLLATYDRWTGYDWG